MPRRGRTYNNLTLNAYWFGVSFMWNSIHPIVLPVLVLSLFREEIKNTALGVLTFVGLMVALVVQPLSGALSDLTRHRMGSRRPWILLGTLLDVVWLFTIALAKSWWAVAIGYLLLQCSSNLAHGPAQGLIPDMVPKSKRGIASGIKVLIDMSGVMLAAVVVGRLMSGESPRPLLPVVVIVGVLLVSMTVTLVGVRESPSRAAQPSDVRPMLDRLRAAFAVDVSGQRDYARLLLSRFCMLLGTYSVQSFGFYYLRDVFPLEDPARMVGNVMAVIAVSITVAAYPAGALSEHWGRKRVTLIACTVVGLSMALLSITRNLTWLWVLGCFIGLGMGMFSSVNWAWATDLVPASEAGKYLGLSNLATAGSAAASRLLGPFVDLINARVPSGGYVMLFALAAVAALICLIVTLTIPETRQPPGALQPTGG